MNHMQKINIKSLVGLMPLSVSHTPHVLRALASITNTSNTQNKSRQIQTGLRQDGVDEDEDEDQDMPSAANSEGATSPPPGFFFVSGGAAASALLAVSVAGVGMVGMFMLGNYMSQVMKGLKASDRNNKDTSSSSGHGDLKQSVNLSTLQLAGLVRQRRADLEAEMKRLKNESSMVPESMVKCGELRVEIDLLHKAGSGRSLEEESRAGFLRKWSLLKSFS
ncbi:hypothetical protein CEUSTIGMA_g5835.t1 [Chlamydomonas eustigma]|uniref:Uncharacterized protein n=1 Tax=Chlamydomonas eustigma TaxID=1157962 RepID=A0A250X5N6_9CHLO|nr:hypothetical protein CEUSTIGMA_g5835.t1 [Chlamydomonas eustigma]|eukprot:GAX78393.1 hypothetical protein CEUSTIGMA_g5835.t1 [Chlamydomonas eustigma]